MDLPTIVGRIISIFLSVLGIVLLGYIFYGGWLWMSAKGDADQAKKARTVFRNAVVGLVIIASAFAITQFILAQIMGGIFGEGTGEDGRFGGFFNNYETGVGDLGKVIRDHYPRPNQVGVPRNTSIFITFTEPMKIASFIDGYNDNGTPDNLLDDVETSTHTLLNTNIIKIYKTSEGITRALPSGGVHVQFTPDRQTFVFMPVDYLGSSDAEVGYTVQLMGGTTSTNTVAREVDGKPALGPSGYHWRFETSRIIDLTPPQVVSAIPESSPDPYAPNIIIQVNFSEPMNPMSVAGSWHIAGRPDFTNIEVSALGSGVVPRPSGTFTISNNFSTIEFLTDSPCGINSCGQPVYCLPYLSEIGVDVKAASLASVGSTQARIIGGLFDGAVDAANNSLDGNKNGTCEGPGAPSAFDDHVMGFRTSDHPELAGPQVRQFTPPNNASLIPITQLPGATFDTSLRAATVVCDNIKIINNEPEDMFWFIPSLSTNPAERPISARFDILHRPYMMATSTFTPEYDPFIYSGLQNVYQNCFSPAMYQNTVTPDDHCIGTPENSNCCGSRGSLRTPALIAQHASCTYPTLPRP